MNSPKPFLLQAGRWLAFASSSAIIVGIAPSQILLGLAIAALLLSGEKNRRDGDKYQQADVGIVDAPP